MSATEAESTANDAKRPASSPPEGKPKVMAVIERQSMPAVIAEIARVSRLLVAVTVRPAGIDGGKNDVIWNTHRLIIGTLLASLYDMTCEEFGPPKRENKTTEAKTTNRTPITTHPAVSAAPEQVDTKTEGSIPTAVLPDGVAVGARAPAPPGAPAEPTGAPSAPSKGFIHLRPPTAPAAAVSKESNGIPVLDRLLSTIKNEAVRKEMRGFLLAAADRGAIKGGRERLLALDSEDTDRLPSIAE
jgi:hypothetical protein